MTQKTFSVNSEAAKLFLQSAPHKTMSAQFAGIIAPHPLSILPHEANRKIIKSYEELIKQYLNLTKAISNWQPDTIITISPRGNCYLEGITINNPLSNIFVAKLEEIKQEDIIFEADRAAIHSITKSCDEQAFPLIESDEALLNFGEIVPLFYLTKGLATKPELISLTMGLISLEKHFQLGKIIHDYYTNTSKKVLFIACADLSHRLTKKSPGGFSPYAKVLDSDIRADLKNQNYESITLYNSIELEEAAEAGIRPICTLLGFMQNTPHQFYEHNYSSPEGVGYLLASTFKL